MEDTKVKIPGAGYQAVGQTCPECFMTLERTSDATPFPGQQFDCYSCMNRFTVVRTEHEEESIFDRFSTVGAHKEYVHSWGLRGIVFNRALLRENRCQKWLAEHGIEYKSITDIGVEFLEYTIDETPGGADVYVKLGDGIYGRVVQDSKEI